MEITTTQDKIAVARKRYDLIVWPKAWNYIVVAIILVIIGMGFTIAAEAPADNSVYHAINDSFVVNGQRYGVQWMEPHNDNANIPATIFLATGMAIMLCGLIVGMIGFNKLYGEKWVEYRNKFLDDNK